MIRNLLHTLLLFSLASCHRQEIRVYTVEKENQNEAAIQTHPAKVSMPTSLPDGWEPLAPSGMRKASYHIQSVGNDSLDCSVISFPGVAGGLDANVNRWRKEVGLEALGASELRASIIHSAIDNHKALIVDINGHDRATLGAIVPLKHETWFFKLSGSPKAISSQKENFASFLENVRIDATQAEALGQFTATQHQSRSLERPTITYRLPEGWKEMQPTTMRVASFSIPGTGGLDADVSVIPLPGKAGTDLSSLNQWRRQLKLEEVTQIDDLSIRQIGNLKYKVVDISSTEALINGEHKARILVAFTEKADHKWFFKMVGAESVVVRETQNFFSMISSVAYGE
ncbi:MAG: hypothetical protein GY899_09405 [Verrucomicrobiaceae bacterium]|nr:hypothetical protein [Verrucomicrobiaceae bacterium]